jgi:hypothetical protein
MDDTITSRHEPSSTLGRNGNHPEGTDLLAQRLEQLDALLVVLAGVPDAEGLTDFRRLNGQVQQATLDLAADLAQQAHELHTKLLPERCATRVDAPT